MKICGPFILKGCVCQVYQACLGFMLLSSLLKTESVWKGCLCKQCQRATVAQQSQLEADGFSDILGDNSGERKLLSKAWKNKQRNKQTSRLEGKGQKKVKVNKISEQWE